MGAGSAGKAKPDQPPLAALPIMRFILLVM
jgi:hypothetical protein